MKNYPSQAFLKKINRTLYVCMVSVVKMFALSQIVRSFKHYTLHIAHYTFLIVFLPLIGFSQTSKYYKYPIVNFTPKQYGPLQAPQNWSLAQSKEGLIYIGNANGVMEYDGSKWEFIPVILGQKVFSLAIDSSNKIFVGSFGQFGYLEKDSLNGKLAFVSLVDKLREEDRNFTNVWRIYATGKKVYFQSNEAIFVYDSKTVKLIEPESSFHLALFADGVLYARDRHKGLVKFENDNAVLLSKNEVCSEYGVFALLPDAENASRLMLVTQERGLFWMNKQNGNLSEINTPDKDFLLKSKIFGGISLPGNLYALNTEFSGTLIINKQGIVQRIINDEIGLQNNYVIAQYFDKTGNLWLALNKGLSKVDWFSPLQTFDETSGIHGIINDAMVWQNNEYVASSDGLFIRQNGTAKFVQDKTIKHVAKKFLLYNNSLLLGTEEGLFMMDKKGMKKVFNNGVTALYYSSTLKKLLAGTHYGIFILNDKFATDLHIADVAGEIFEITEGKTEKDTKPVVWVSTQNGSTYVFDASSPIVKLNSFSVEDGLPRDWIYPFSYQGKIHFGSNYGLFDLEGRSFDTVGMFDQAVLFGKKFMGSFSNFTSNNKGDFYYVAENKVHLYKVNEKLNLEIPFLPIELGKINSINVSNGKVYISCNEGLVVFNEQDIKNYKANFSTVLRKLAIGGDSVVFNGGFTGKFVLNEQVKYSLNKLSCEFSSSYFFEEKGNMYAYKLDGLDTAYSNWARENTINLNNLSHGKYTLWIKSKNIFGVESEALTIEFAINPPWYLTTVAYICYAIAFVLIIIAAGKISSYRVKKQNRVLEGLVQQRTAEIAQKNEALELQNEQILHQKQEITDSINYAKRIQSAILPPEEEMRIMFRDLFVLFMPKDIVSGDFYWFHKLSEEEFLIACADCTGHGVPGGFMSMVCTDKLNEAVKQYVLPGDILGFVNKAIRKSLRQGDGLGGNKDGMEISLLHVNTKSRKVIYAGANRFLWIVKNNAEEVLDIKPTKAGIGGFTDANQHFENNEFVFDKNDMLYLSSDGYGDQFGGDKQKKLTTRRFKEILLEQRSKSIEDQYNYLRNFIRTWQKDLEQVDDILVIGMRF